MGTRSGQAVRLRRCGATGSLILVTLGLCGCQDPLLVSTDERSQYDRYDRVRNEFAPQYIEDEFGRREPNLMGRLAPR